MLSNRFKQCHISGHFQVKPSFDFPKYIPACPGRAITLPWRKPPATCFLSVFELSQEFPVLASWPPAMPVYSVLQMDRQLCFLGKRWQTSFPKFFYPSEQPQMRTCLPACLPTLNKPKLALLKSRVSYPPFSPPLRGVKHTANYPRSFLSVFVSRSLLSKLIPIFNSQEQM